MVLENSIQIIGEGSEDWQSCPAIIPANHTIMSMTRKEINARSGTQILVSTTRCLIGLKAQSTEGKSGLALDT